MTKKIRTRDQLLLTLVVTVGFVLVGLIPGYAQELEGYDIVFEADFADDEIGSQPAAMEVSGSKNNVRIVEDSGLESGKALSFKGMDPDLKSISARFPALWDMRALDANVIVVDFSIKWVHGKNNLYVTRDKAHFLHWWVDSGGLRASTANGNVTVGRLKEGWNHVRLVADREKSRFDLYLNDMSEPAGASLPFRAEADSWAGVTVSFAMTPHSEEYEILYGDIKVALGD